MPGPNTENVSAPETVPPGLATCTLYMIGELSRLEGTAAVSVPLLVNVVADATPFRVTVDTADSAALTTKFAPFTVRTVALDPAGTDTGRMGEMEGANTLKGRALEVALPGCTTVTLATPAVASSALGMNAASWVLMYVVASGVVTPPAVHCTWLPGIWNCPTATGPTKLVPVTVMVRLPAPVPDVFGNRDVVVGTSTISMVSVPLTALPQKSATVNWKLGAPMAVGVPVMVALTGCTVRPAGGGSPGAGGPGGGGGGR